MGKEKKAVLVYHDFYEHLKDLSFEDKGKIFDAILEYDMTGTVSIELGPVLNMAFKFIKAAIDRDKESYNKKCIKNSQNGSKGGRPNLEKPNGLEDNQNNQTVFNETQINPKNLTVNLETQKSERFFEKPKKADNDTDNENENENENDPLPIEGVAGGDINALNHSSFSGREGGIFTSFLKRVKDKIPDEHIENCYLALVDIFKNEAEILKCADDWLLTVFNQNGKTNFPAKSLVEYARANFQKYKSPSKRTPDSTITQEFLKKYKEYTKNCISPLEFTRDEALNWLRYLPAFWREKSKIARNLIKKYRFSESDYKQVENQQ